MVKIKDDVYEIMHQDRRVARIDKTGHCKIYFKSFMPYNLYFEEEEDIDTVLEEADDLTTLIHKACQLNVSTVQKTYQMINEGQLQKAIEYMINAKTIYLFGVGSSAIVAYDFSQKLLRIGKKAI